MRGRPLHWLYLDQRPAEVVERIISIGRMPCLTTPQFPSNAPLGSHTLHPGSPPYLSPQPRKLPGRVGVGVLGFIGMPKEARECSHVEIAFENKSRAEGALSKPLEYLSGIEKDGPTTGEVFDLERFFPMISIGKWSISPFHHASIPALLPCQSRTWLLYR